MSKVKSNLTGFIGINGRSVHVEEGEEFDSDHEVVLFRPDVFGIPGPVRVVETVGEIEDVEPDAVEIATDEPDADTATVAPKRRGRPKSNV